ncbi:MAG: ureidoglycolate lyase [Gemmatimonadota bacterium]
MTAAPAGQQGPVRCTAAPPDPDAFAPFGAFVIAPARVGDRAHFSEWLVPVDGLAQQSHMNRVAPTPLPAVVRRVERHPHAAQLFVPVGVSRYLVTVMPSDADGGPDRERAHAFVVPGTTGVVYRPGTWHAGIAVLDHEASFGVFMWRGAEDDDVFEEIAPLEVVLPPHRPGSEP